ncbi:MAG: helicase-associated domain-containing protein [Anaerolineae bacterium]|nr:helicase-associated domain-containing protein [Anaerolineae bacterium]
MAIADLWGAAIVAASHGEAVEALAAHILDERTLRAVRDALPEDAREALAALLQAEGKLPLAVFERRFGAVRLMGPGRFERERPWLSPQNPAEVLWHRGLVFRAFDRINGTPAEVVFIPSDLLALIKALDPAADRAAEQAAQPAPQRARVGRLFLDDLTTLLCHIQNHTVRLRSDGSWDASARRAVLPLLHSPDGVTDGEPAGRFALLTRLMGRLGWVRSAEGRARLISQPVLSWLQSPTEAQAEVVLRAWLDDESLNELALLKDIRLDLSQVNPDLVRAARRAVARWLDEQYPDVTLPLDARRLEQFVAFVRQHHPDFLRPDGRYDTWRVTDVASGAALDGFEHWDRVEGALIRYWVTCPLRWLSEAAEEMTTPSPLKVTADGLVTVSSAARYERFQLSRVADWVRTGGRAFVYALTPRSLGRARAQGIRAHRVVEFLERHAGHSLPASLKQAIFRWEERGAEVQLSPVVLLRAPDAGVLDALVRQPEIQRAVLERLTPTIAAIRARNLEEVRAAIVESGLLAATGDEDEQVT